MKRIHALYPISLTAIGFVSIQLFTLVLASDQRQEAVKSAPATVFMVTNVNNNGPGSLAQAILDANANPGADTITFSIGAGAQTINLTSALPNVSGPVTIDGTTQPGFSGAPLIELNGASAGGASSGLVILGGSSTIKGLVINRFASGGIRLASIGGNTIQGCYIGTDITGAVDLGNAQDGISVETANNIIGGSLLAARNIISGNGRFGILLTGIPATGNAIKNNLIGTNKLGTMELGNSSSGIQIQAGARNNLIGGPMFGDGNIISGNDEHGIYITNTGSNSNTIQGNYIGTDLDGLHALGNSLTGVRIDTSGNVVGGITSGSRNVISGNKEYGVMIIGNTAADNHVIGNFIGLDASGNADIGNLIDGVILQVNVTNNTIGGPGTARNIISGNDRNGVFIDNGATNNRVQGNIIGLNLTGSADVGNGQEGVALSRSSGNFIGSVSSGAGNVISGNDRHGVFISDSTATANQLLGNYIGTDANGAGDLGNAQDGVHIEDASNNTVGGSILQARNIISGNDQSGVRVISGTGNNVLANSIHSNTGLGIDLGPMGVTFNDSCDTDAGANDLQNFPVLTSATTTSAGVTVTGILDTLAASSFRIEFFVNAACDPSTHGEGQTFLGSTTVTTTAGCSASFTAVFSAAVVPGQFITATATGPSNNTSEFSACVQATCDYSISPASRMFKSRGSEASFNVTAPAGCNWTAVPSDDWIIITSTESGSGSGTVSYLVRDNSTASTRQGAIIVAGQTHTIVQSGQAGGCSYTISPTFNSFGSSGGNGLINVTTGSGCAWEARSKENWISITSGSSGSGSGLVTYTVASNPTATDRNGTIIIAGLAFNIKQQGCDQQSQQAKIIAGDGVADDFLGFSTAISGNTLVVGDVNDDTFAGTDAGSAYVYVRDGTNWVEQQRLFASDGAPFQLFGHSVAISGDTIVVGASGSVTGIGSSTGAVYVFARQGNTWTERKKLTAIDGALSDEFGYSVAISGGTIVVGAIGDDTAAGFETGSAYVFVGSGNIWGLQQKLTAGDATSGDEFGGSVAVEGNRVVIGASHNSTPSVFEAGSVYVFERTGGVWSQQAELFANDGATSDFFGWSVGLSGNTIVAGAYRDDNVRGSVYVFEGGGFSWIQKAKLMADDGASNDRLGYSVAISGNRVVAGAYLADPFSISNAGAAYIFDRSGAIWTQTQKLVANDAAANDEFGFSVAIGADSTIAVGARGVNASRGAAYVFAGCGFPLPFAEQAWLRSDRSTRAFVANQRPCSILFLL